MLIKLGYTNNKLSRPLKKKEDIKWKTIKISKSNEH